MSTVPTWPPPPDLHSIQELVAAADVEGFIANGSPADEYETEADAIYNTIRSWPKPHLTTEHLLPVIEQTWTGAFALDDHSLASRRVRLRGLAAEIARFFGPGATPQVRGS